MNAIFQVIQNLLRRKEQKARCPYCKAPLPRRDAPRNTDEPDGTDEPDSPNPGAPRCPSCGRPLSGDDTP